MRETLTAPYATIRAVKTNPEIHEPSGPSADADKPWLMTFGKLRRLRKETARINRVIEDEFSRIEPED